MKMKQHLNSLLSLAQASKCFTPFGGGHTNVSQNTSLGLFWPTGFNVAHGMKMFVSSMFFVLIATPLDLHGGSGLVVHSGHPPHTVTHVIHEYHVDIPWISMPLCGFRSTARVANK